MIPTTRRKLRETHFFLQHLRDQFNTVIHNEPEAFRFFLSAFLSAGRSVTFTLQVEEKEKYDQRFETWYGKLKAEDQKLLKFMNRQRVSELHRSGAETQMRREPIPIMKLPTDDRGHPAYGFHCVAPGGTPQPQIIRSQTFEVPSFELPCCGVPD